MMLAAFICAILFAVGSAQINRCNFQQNNETLGRIYMTGNDCTFYYKCDENGIEHTKEPCEQGFVFDPFRRKCVPSSESVNCDVGPEYYARFDQLCSSTKEGNVAMPGDNSMYIPCWRYRFRFPPMKCSPGTIFYAEQGQCDHIDQESRDYVRQQRQDGYAQNKNINNFGSYRADGGYEQDIVGTSVCIFKPVPGNCNRYTDCDNIADIRQCPESTFMSRSNGVCVFCHELSIEERAECQLKC